MKTNQTLMEKIKEAEIKMPGVANLLQNSRGSCWGIQWASNPEDVQYLRISGYDVLAVKWDEHQYSDDGGGVAWNEWMTIHYRNDQTGEIKTVKTEEINTRDATNPRYDKDDLWQYDYAGIAVKDTDTIEAYWANSEGKKGPSYLIKLD